MKLWDELTNLEKREAIARRLGEEKPDDSLLNSDLILAGGQSSPKGYWHGVMRYDEGDVPRWEPSHWTTSDGRAFAEIFVPHLRPLGINISQRGENSSPMLEFKDHSDNRTWLGSTYADAICFCAYDLLSEEEER